jgi:sodium/bile acid cotransporter 7
MVFCIVPTTLGVGVALTAAARGNQALALFLTVVTNLLGIATIPFTLRAVLADSGAAALVRIDPLDLATKLLFTVLVPTALGVGARRASTRLAAWTRAHKRALGLFSHSNLICIIWQTLSAASRVLLRQRAGDVLAVVAIAAALHLALLLLLHLLFTRALRLPIRERIAVVIMSAQKSAPVAVTVITYITDDAAQQGLFAIPALVGQLTQIFIGSALARTLAKQVRAHEEAQAAAASDAAVAEVQPAGGGAQRRRAGARRATESEEQAAGAGSPTATAV